LDSIEGHALLLKPQVVQNLRDIVTRAHNLFEHMKIPYHVTGGTLLGIVRHKTIPMPFDDDVDMCVDYEFRETLFSPDFNVQANLFGLQAKYLAGNGLQRADVHGAAVRLQIPEHDETCDVFFWKTEEDKVCKVDSWLNGGYTFNSREQFKKEDVFPRQKMVVDDLEVFVPNDPTALLFTQYGQDVLKTAKIRPRLISHAFPMKFLRLLWWSCAT